MHPLTYNASFGGLTLRAVWFAGLYVIAVWSEIRVVGSWIIYCCIYSNLSMGTDLSESRRERSEERRWGDSLSRKSVEVDDPEECDKEKVKDKGKHRSKDKTKSGREEKDHRSRDKDRSKTKDGYNGREKEVKESGKVRISSREKRKEGTEEHEKDREKDKGREKESERDKDRGKAHDRDEDRDRKRDRGRDRGNEPESDRGAQKEREKEKGKEKERPKEKGRDRDKGKDREREKEKEKTREREKEREQDKNKDTHLLDREKDKDYTREKERELNHGKERLSRRSRDDHDRDKDEGKDPKAKGDSDYNRDRDSHNQGKASLEEVDAVHIKHGDYVEDSSAAQNQSRKEIEERISKMKEERMKRKSDGASEILSWVNKSRKLEDKIQFERQKAKQRSKILNEQDNVDDDDDDEEEFSRSKGATDSLAGVKVLHGFDKVLEGGSVVLTLKDQEILADGDINENLDMLENVEIGEQKRRNEAYKAGKKNAGMYDDKFNDQPGEEKKMLPQYDDPTEEEGVTLDVAGRFTADKKLEELRRKLQIPSHSNQVEDLNSSVRTSSDYYTPEEMLQFKKPKKKKSLRKREKLDLDALEAEARAEGLGVSDLRSRSDSKGQVAKEEQERAEAKRRSTVFQAAFARADEASKALRTELTLFSVQEEDDAEVFADDDEDLQKSLERARKLALNKQTEKAPTGPEAIARLAASAIRTQSVDVQDSTSGDALENKVVFTEMEEFVWGLQLDEDTQKPDHEDVFMEEDEAPKMSEQKKDETSGWAEILESGTDEPSMTEIKEEIVPDDTIHEAPVGKGLSGALKLLKDRGALKETTEWGGRNTDKKKSKLVGIHDDEGPKEIHLERRDEFGRVLTPKEAFRLISHKFHGKGPGKGKQEKRMKQYQDEQRLKQMTSSDVLPQSVERMREAQLQSKTPYLVLSGNVRPG
ncbi:hypothetical protein KSS87_003445 [Heliosperma pusillum]|nr:hypothetical protein KSS87_003445 [Heliosperma pusillum]